MKMKIKVEWCSCDINLTEVANDIGYNLPKLKSVTKKIKDKVSTRAVSVLNSNTSEDSNDHFNKSLNDIKKGVYIIAFQKDIFLKYKDGHSHVIYIGKGNIKERLIAHFKSWLSDLSYSLHGANLKLYFNGATTQGSGSIHSYLEYDLIKRFKAEYGEYPIKNKQIGTKHGKQIKYSKSWTMPFILPTGAQKGWVIEPLGKNSFKK
ncbi:MAG TPA: hypothetical protein VMU29_15040 [Smithella sp.]|nr:hypothetical protein [Smithella sp.]